jgi:hypothetical protein
MQLRQDIQRNDESIATVDYRLIERVAEIDESFDTFDARVSVTACLDLRLISDCV